MQSFETSRGHFVKVIPVRSCGGTQEGRWQVRVFGPSINLQCGFKCLYTDANATAVVEVVAEYLGVHVSGLRKPLARPRMLVGFDVETSGTSIERLETVLGYRLQFYKKLLGLN